MRACCPLSACVKSRALLLWAAVLIPLGVLVAVAVAAELRDPARAAVECCPSAAEREAAPSCEEMHRRLHVEPSSHALEASRDSRPPPACPAAP